MEIIYFNPRNTKEGNSLFDIIRLYKNPEDNVVVLDSIDAFTKKLKNIKDGNTVTVIFASKEDDVIDLYFQKHYLYKTFTVLILPNNKKEIIALGQRCNPFFLISDYNDLKKIGSIIRILSSRTYRDYREGDFRNAA